MNIENLVPPLELCDRIELRGHFEDSAFIWAYIDGRGWKICDRGTPCMTELPAPTLQEIMAEIDMTGIFCPTCYRLHGSWQVDYEKDGRLYEEEDRDSPVNAAMRLWLRLNGRKDEK